MQAKNVNDIIASYEHLADVTSRMREAAVRDDWDRVIALETECAGLYTQLMSVRDQGPQDSARERRKSELICKVLEDDAQIRERLSGQLVHIWRLIEGERRVSKLNSAYGASADGQ
ncbi:MAG TPA: flagellar protein FliT [Burkholderiales bacterium]|nr:flagellar protein FliT [Burkholderiales bacterium]